MPGKHGPNRLGNYLTVHESWMAAFRAEGFVIQDDARFTFLPSVVVLEGSIICLDGITIEVRKEVEILDGHGMSALVQTRAFRYHAWIQPAHNIYRYESAHEHRPCAHKHVYDTFGHGAEMVVIELLEEDDIPTLGEAIRELEEWHETNAGRIKSLP